MSTCKIDGCERPRYTKANTRMCLAHHYAIYRRRDKPLLWSSLVADIDQAVITRILAGDHPPATTFERREAVRILTDRGHSARRIAEQVGASTRTVVRDRTLTRTPAVSTAGSTLVHSNPKTAVEADPMMCTPTGSPLLISVAGQVKTGRTDTLRADSPETPVDEADCRRASRGLTA